MRVKIGNKIYDSAEQPLTIFFDAGEKELISNMLPQNIKFSSSPNGFSVSEVEPFINSDDDQLSMVIEDGVLKLPTECGEVIECNK